jgi:hypothetical protein
MYLDLIDLSEDKICELVEVFKQRSSKKLRVALPVGFDITRLIPLNPDKIVEFQIVQRLEYNTMLNLKVFLSAFKNLIALGINSFTARHIDFVIADLLDQRIKYIHITRYHFKANELTQLIDKFNDSLLGLYMENSSIASSNSFSSCRCDKILFSNITTSPTIEEEVINLFPRELQLSRHHNAHVKLILDNLEKFDVITVNIFNSDNSQLFIEKLKSDLSTKKLIINIAIDNNKILEAISLSNLKSLDCFSSGTISSEFLIKAMANGKLKSLKFEGVIDDTESVLRELIHNNSITDIVIIMDEFEGIYPLLVEIITHNTTLVRIDLSYHTENTTPIEVLEALKINNTLRKFAISSYIRDNLPLAEEILNDNPLLRIFDEGLDQYYLSNPRSKRLARRRREFTKRSIL